MNMFLRVLAVLAGIALILPGLCTLGFGGFFTIGGGQSEWSTMGIMMIFGGGVVALAGLLLIIAGVRR